MACSSSSTQIIPHTSGKKHDVFISFRGEDTRSKFTSQLYAALKRKKIETYIDHKLQRGDEISPALLSAIRQSRVSVVIFSENYASSSWCLDELLHMLECKNRSQQLVIPVFYDIDPSLVRHQRGSYAEGLAKLEQRSEEMADKVIKWRAALTEAADLSGWDSKITRPDAELVEAIASDILNKLNNISPRCNHFEGKVGIEKRSEIIKSLLRIGSPDVRIVGLLGMGGIGKTTIAEVVFMQLSSQFESCYFLRDVREKSEKHQLDKFRKELLSTILEEENRIMGNIAFVESTFARRRLQTKRVLIVLDDVDKASQFESLVEGHQHFGPGSRIIVTTRNRQVLTCIEADDAIYEVEELDDSEALQLFQLNAFRKCSPEAADYSELSQKVVHYTKGVPLALKVLGSFLRGKSKQEWEAALSKLKVIPHMDVQHVLRISYDGLDDTEKDLFLDVACFFKGECKDFVQRVLDGCGFFPVVGMMTLVDKCLITIENNLLQMHDLIQEMGWHIVRSIKEPGERSRLWNAEDAYRVLKNNSGTRRTEGMSLDMSNLRELELDKNVFKKTKNLRLLKIYNSEIGGCKVYLPQGLTHLPDSLVYLHWESYPLKSLPANFALEKLVELHMPNSQVDKLWDGIQNLGNLRTFNLSSSKRLTQLPDLSLAPNLESVELTKCVSLREIPSYIRRLDKITYLSLAFCSQIKILSELPQDLEDIGLCGTAIEDLPPRFESLHKVRKLDLRYTTRLFPCSSLYSDSSKFPRNITYLDLSHSGIRVVPSSIQCLSSLVELYLNKCPRLEILPTSICKLKSLERLSISECLEFKNFPEILDPHNCLPSLVVLDLSESNVENLPPSINQLPNLHRLHINNCKRLESLPELPSTLQFLDARGCTILENVSSSSRALTKDWCEHVHQPKEEFMFFNCPKLDQNAKTNIMVHDARLRILRIATLAGSRAFDDEDVFVRSTSCTHCPGNEIPMWYNWQNVGSSIEIMFSPNWFQPSFLGFAICALVDFDDFDGYYDPARNEFLYFDFLCKSHFKTKFGESHIFDRYLNIYDGFFRINKSSFVLQYFYDLVSDIKEKNEEANWSESCFHDVTCAEFHLYPQGHDSRGQEIPCDFIMVKQCGIQALYEQEAEVAMRTPHAPDSQEPECVTRKRRKIG